MEINVSLIILYEPGSVLCTQSSNIPGPLVRSLFKNNNLHQVISKGQTEGPAGVNLAIKKKGKEEILKTTTTQTGGDFTFEKVLPGEYTIEASHPLWTFQTVGSLVLLLG